MENRLFWTYNHMKKTRPGRQKGFRDNDVTIVRSIYAWFLGNFRLWPSSKKIQKQFHVILDFNCLSHFPQNWAFAAPSKQLGQQDSPFRFKKVVSFALHLQHLKQSLWKSAPSAVMNFLSKIGLLQVLHVKTGFPIAEVFDRLLLLPDCMLI